MATFFKDKQKDTIFRSYWVHTVFQAAVLAIMFLFKQDSNVIFGFVILSSSILTIFIYIVFQFPVTGLLLLWCHDLTNRLAFGQGLFFRIITSTGFFVIASSLIFLIATYVFLLNRSPEPPNLVVLLEILFTYFTPILLSGELIRQRLVMKQVYGENAK